MPVAIGVPFPYGIAFHSCGKQYQEIQEKELRAFLPRNCFPPFDRKSNMHATGSVFS
jgi:hypothetical protein